MFETVALGFRVRRVAFIFKETSTIDKCKQKRDATLCASGALDTIENRPNWVDQFVRNNRTQLTKSVYRLAQPSVAFGGSSFPSTHPTQLLSSMSGSMRALFHGFGQVGHPRASGIHRWSGGLEVVKTRRVPIRWSGAVVVDDIGVGCYRV